MNIVDSSIWIESARTELLPLEGITIIELFEK